MAARSHLSVFEIFLYPFACNFTVKKSLIFLPVKNGILTQILANLQIYVVKLHEFFSEISYGNGEFWPEPFTD